MATVTCCGLLGLIASRAGAADPPWPMYQGNPAHTGYLPVTLNPSNFALRWSKIIHSGVALNPVAAAEGKVFVSEYGYFSATDGLYALDAATGNLLWSTNYGNVFSVNAPSYAYGNVYIETGNGTGAYIAAVHAHQASTGALVYSSPISAQWERYLAPTIYGGNVYVDGGGYGGMYSFNGTNGTQNWFGYVAQYDGWTPAVDTNYCYVFTGSGDTVPILGQFRIIDRWSGNTLHLVTDNAFQWNGYTMNEAVTLGTHSDAFAINEPGSVYPNYGTNGRLLMFDLRADSIHTPHIGWVLNDRFTGQPTFTNGMIYVNDGGSLAALDELTGEPLWAWAPPAGGSLTDTMIVTDSHLLAGSANAVYAVNLHTHQADWSYPVSGHLALGEGVLYVAAGNGTLTAITASSVNTPTNQPPVSRSGGPYSAECKGPATVVQLDGSGSSDPDGDKLTFSWSTDCYGAMFDNPSSPTPKLTLDSFAAQTCHVTLEVSDGQLTNSSQATVTVVDTQPPTLTCASNKVVECGSLWRFDPPSATDVCCGTNVTVTVLGTATNSCAAGSCLASITRTWLATDCSGNSSTCSQTVTVADTQPPTLTCASNKVVQCGSSWSFDPPSATDPCCGTNVTVTVVGTVTNSCAAGSCMASITRTWLATGCSGNSSTCSQTVTVRDTQPPDLSQVSANPTKLWPPNHKLVPVSIEGAVTDTCDPAPTWQIISVTSSDAVAGPGTAREPDYQITGAHTLLLRAERNDPHAGRTYQVTLQAKDASGNTSNGSVLVTVPGSDK